MSNSNILRRGLPRYSGGEPWPPAGEAGNMADAGTLDLAQDNTDAPLRETARAEIPLPAAKPVLANEPLASAPLQRNRTLRQGLPRTPGGLPWPSASTVKTFVAETALPEAQVLEEANSGPAIPTATSQERVDTLVPAVSSAGPRGAMPRADVRQGLPRIVGGEPWPPVSAFSQPAIVMAEPATIAPARAPKAAEAGGAPVQPPNPLASVAAARVRPTAPSRQALSPKATAQASPISTPTTAAAARSGKAEPTKHGPLTSRQWVLAAVLGAFCALGMATAVVLVARWFVGFDAVSSFVARYPGEYHLPASSPVGVPAWLGWQHFFNLFLMVLIIRTGMQVRHQKKPPAYWSSKRSPKVSINLWLHQSLDVLWLVNGAVFIVLLFATGHWMRIVPTSWEVFPHAISAALQYLTLDWPTENGWVNYNSLQQLAYFSTVFLAAPLAAVTGFRMSAFWPANAKRLSKAYPVELARKLHFPTMLYFVVFIFVHVALVLSTGALRNLNHMYAAQGSVDPNAFADNWTGLWMFAASLLVIAGAWLACRPILLTPLAQLFGKVSSR